MGSTIGFIIFGPENNEASAELTTANGGTFTSNSARPLANHVTARSISDRRALT